jgi:hypothetical protein
MGLLCGVAIFDAACDSSSQPSSSNQPSTGTGGASNTGGSPQSPEGAAHTPNFFVTSDTHPNGNLGGLDGADARCARLASAAGLAKKTWHAYLSAEHGTPGGAAVNARDRIGTGPWYNVNGILVATDLAALHSRVGDAEVFIDEKGSKVNGQWSGSPQPNQHDILTGTSPDGTVMATMTCADWTSDQTGMAAQVGHSDGLGPNMNSAAPFSSWHSSHANQDCSNTTPRGGAGKIYCFAVD